MLIDNYIIRYDNQKKLNTPRIFYSKQFLLEDIENKNAKLLELLLKYSEIRKLKEEITKKNEANLISLRKLYQLNKMIEERITWNCLK